MVSRMGILILGVELSGMRMLGVCGVLLYVVVVLVSVGVNGSWGGGCECKLLGVVMILNLFFKLMFSLGRN